LIEVEGAKTPSKMLMHFHRAWAGSGKLNQSPAGSAGQVRPSLNGPREGPFNPADANGGKEAQRQPRRICSLKKLALELFHNSS
jgi:hypothetical protein